MYEDGRKGLQILFKKHQDSLPEVKGYVGFGILHDIVKLLTIYGESKSGLSIY